MWEIRQMGDMKGRGQRVEDRQGERQRVRGRGKGGRERREGEGGSWVSSTNRQTNRQTQMEG